MRHSQHLINLAAILLAAALTFLTLGHVGVASLLAVASASVSLTHVSIVLTRLETMVTDTDEWLRARDEARENEGLMFTQGATN